jgi:hypothetical protein
MRPDLPRELTETLDACLSPRPNHRPTLEDLGTAIEDSLDLLADDAGIPCGRFGSRFAALGFAAALGAWLALGHGPVLP